MQALASEFGYSETTFVLPPRSPAHTAWVRIFTPSREILFAGHPNIGTAFVLATKAASRQQPLPDVLVFEEIAGLVPVRQLKEVTPWSAPNWSRPAARGCRKSPRGVPRPVYRSLRAMFASIRMHLRLLRSACRFLSLNSLHARRCAAACEPRRVQDFAAYRRRGVHLRLYAPGRLDQVRKDLRSRRAHVHTPHDRGPRHRQRDGRDRRVDRRGTRPVGIVDVRRARRGYGTPKHSLREGRYAR